MATISDDFFSDNPDFDKLTTRLYGRSGAECAARFKTLCRAHKETFGSFPEQFYSSPGRIEIVGNHTDHQGGKVLAAAVNVDTLAAVSTRSDALIEIKSNGYPMLEADSSDPVYSASEKGTSVALIKGVCEYFLMNGMKTGGFSASMSSTVPKGSGVSSSSSFELAVAEILNRIYNDGKLGEVFKAKAAQYAENKYFGKPCGLMDQTAIALGGVNLIDFGDFENPLVERTHWTFDDLAIFVIAAGGDHSDLTDDYASIPDEMGRVAVEFGKKRLCEVSEQRFRERESELYRKLPARAVLRAEHYYEENERVERALDAILDRDRETFLKCVNESGESSRDKLKNLYSEKTGDKSLIDALDAVGKVQGVVAKRVHGGGFAGTILVLTEADAAKRAEMEFHAAFGKENVFRLRVRESGAERLELKGEV